MSAAGKPLNRIGAIQEATAAAYGVALEDMLSARRKQPAAFARQVAMTLAHDLTGYSLPRIGRAFFRDHTTVMHALRVVRARLAEDAHEAARFDELRQALAGPTGEPDQTQEARAQQLIVAAELAVQRETQALFARLKEAAERDPMLVIRRLNQMSITLVEELYQ